MEHRCQRCLIIFATESALQFHQNMSMPCVTVVSPLERMQNEILYLHSIIQGQTQELQRMKARVETLEQETKYIDYYRRLSKDLINLQPAFSRDWHRLK